MKRRQVKRLYKFEDINSTQSPPKAAEKIKRTIPVRNWWIGVWRYGPYLVAGLVFGYIILFSNFFRINSINVQGPNTALSQDLQSEVEKYLSSRLFGRNWLFLDTGSLRKDLQKSFSGQESILVEKHFPSKLVIKTDEQKPALVWKTGARRFVISVNGRVMSELQPDQTQADLPTVIDSSNVPLNIGATAAGRQFVTFTSRLNNELKKLNLGPNELYIKETTSELIVRTNQGYEIKFDATANAEEQLRALKSVLDLLNSQGKKPVEYIDLRVPGRAFYR